MKDSVLVVKVVEGNGASVAAVASLLLPTTSKLWPVRGWVSISRIRSGRIGNERHDTMATR